MGLGHYLIHALEFPRPEVGYQFRGRREGAVDNSAANAVGGYPWPMDTTEQLMGLMGGVPRRRANPRCSGLWQAVPWSTPKTGAACSVTRATLPGPPGPVRRQGRPGPLERSLPPGRGHGLRRHRPAQPGLSA